MNITRRKFLKFLGLGAVALPVVAKAIEVEVKKKHIPMDIDSNPIFPMEPWGIGIMNQKYDRMRRNEKLYNGVSNPKPIRLNLPDKEFFKLVDDAIVNNTGLK